MPESRFDISDNHDLFQSGSILFLFKQLPNARGKFNSLIDTSLVTLVKTWTHPQIFKIIKTKKKNSPPCEDNVTVAYQSVTKLV